MKIVKINTLKFLTLSYVFIIFLMLYAVFAAAENVRAATYTVTAADDAGSGSLRQAVAAANASADNDTINFNLAGCPNNICTIALGGGELAIDSVSAAGKLTITGSSGAENLIISGQNLSRIFYLRAGSDLTLDGVTVANGTGTGSTFPAANSSGGGIYMQLFTGNPARLTVKNSIIRDNSVLTATNNTSGSAIYNGNGILTVTDSSIKNNAANGAFGAGAIFSNTGTVVVTGSTVSGNSAQRHGGGIYCTSSCVATITNSTVSGNSAGMLGGGIYSNIGTVYLVNSTITNNTAQQGGGVYQTSNPRLYLYNTIIAANNGLSGPIDIANFDVPSDVRSCGNNLIGNTSNTGGTNIAWQTTDILDQPPVIAPLGNYGGSTQTHALLFNSPAIDAGKSGVSTVAGCSTVPAALPSDQRGAARVGNVDIGAFEFNGAGQRKTVLDFNGDGRSDFVIARSADRNSPSTWWISDGSFQNVTQFGIGTTSINSSSPTADRAAPADYDGDGKTDIAVWRPNGTGDGRGVFYILRSSDSSAQISQFGKQGDDPTISGDYDGDGKADLAVFRKGATLTAFDPCGGGAVWYYRPSSETNVNFRYGCWGAGGDTDYPAPGDYDGDGKTDFAVLRNSGGQGVFYLNKSGGGTEAFRYGLGTDQINPGDYDGDGKTDLCIARYDTANPSNNIKWYILTRTGGGTNASPVLFGNSTDLTVQGDYDGDGKTDIAVWRPSDGNFYVRRSSDSTVQIFKWGLQGDFPVGYYNSH